MKLQGTRQLQQLRIHIDEAGRGPLAGPVFMGCTMSLCNFDKHLFQDSKTLSPKKRNEAYNALFEYEQEGKVLGASGRATAKEIDKYGIIGALEKACYRGIYILLKKYYTRIRRQALLDSVHGEDMIAMAHLDMLFSRKKGTKRILRNILHTPNSLMRIQSLIIDGNHTFSLDTGLDIQVITIIKGDSKNPLISAASIIAKVERDTYMCAVEKRNTLYGFAQHKGYGTVSHRQLIARHGVSPLHRVSFCQNIIIKSKKKNNTIRKPRISSMINATFPFLSLPSTSVKPGLLLHICCAPDLTRPLHWLKKHFKLYLFWYNPNIHPRKEHATRYDSFIKLIGLEKGDYEIIEDRYDPKEFFAAMIEEREDIDPKLKHATAKAVLAQAGEMEEWSSRCNPCYSMRLAEAAKNAAKHTIPYFTSTLLISPKKNMDKLMRRGLEGEYRHPSTKFLRFDFAKNKGYEKATQLTKGYGLYRQQYCGCGWTIPKPGEENKTYVGG